MGFNKHYRNIKSVHVEQFNNEITCVWIHTEDGMINLSLESDTPITVTEVPAET